MTIHNRTRGTVIAESARTADSLVWRARGMIGRRFDNFDALVIPRCGSIHTWWMGMAIDVLYVEKNGEICGLRKSLKPWRMSRCGKARTVIELPAGQIDKTGCELGDCLAWD